MAVLLTDIEYISIENQTTAFPKHYHETFCISLIYSGIEQIDFEKSSLFSEAGSISITNPYEIHSNPLLDSKIPLKFDTIYITSELMKKTLNGKNITFVNRQINSDKSNQLFEHLKLAIDTKDSNTIAQCLLEFINQLKTYSEAYEEEYADLNFNEFKSIHEYIEINIRDKFSLEHLAKMANINKFGFSKKFKATTGMAPMNYILMKKIFSSKKLISKSSELTEIAYDYNFSDLAHFSKTFKRYVGVAPKDYQKSLR